MAGTPVLLADGTSKPIEKILVAIFTPAVYSAYNTYSTTANTLAALYNIAVAAAGNTAFTVAGYFNDEGIVNAISVLLSQEASQNAVSTIGKTPEQIRAAARSAFKTRLGKDAAIPAGWQIHHIYPIQFKELFEKAGIDINAVENLRAVDPTVHSHITNIHNEWFNVRVKEQMEILKDQIDEKALVGVAKKVALERITLEEVKELKKSIQSAFRPYLAEATAKSIKSAVSEMKLVAGPKKLAELANKIRKGLGLKLIAGAAVVLALIDGFALAGEIVDPSVGTKYAFDNMMNRYRLCMQQKEGRGYIIDGDWFLLQEATTDYLRAIKTDQRLISAIVEWFEIEGSSLPN